ncbi:MAG: GspE/PulE family protein [Candidatus Wallbacteria bacterium]|nr:GspE/PulE family protein [Candidatus Wallbacteria bacterium]
MTVIKSVPDKKHPVIGLKNFVFDPSVSRLLPLPQAHRFKALPLFLIEGRLSVAMTDPDNIELLDEIARITGCEIAPVSVDAGDINSFIARAYGCNKGDIITDYRNEIRDEFNSISVLNLLLEKAVFHLASDLHLEKSGKEVRIRMRIDGALIEIKPYDTALHEEVISRIKVICGMDIAEQRLPQEGKSIWSGGGKEIDLRIVILPSVAGETAVIRLLNPVNIRKNIEHLGFSDSFTAGYRKLIEKRQGMILICGPTGSGKTTTLYTTIQELDLSANKAISVEDPCEYRLQELTQLEVNRDIGFDYAAGLKAVLRADPDIIMLGEIRDRETAHIALEAAMTGHLVFSTLHTTSSVSAVYRLIEMNLPAFMIVDSLLLVLTQRLVRKNCEYCRTEREIGDQEKITLRNMGVTVSVHYETRGCSRCGGTGFNGRTVLYEALNINDAVRKMIVLGKGEDEIRTEALKSGFIPMGANSTALIESGTISLAEVLQHLRES